MSPNRREMEPDRRAQQRERVRKRSVLIRDAYWALVIVVGGATLIARIFGAREAGPRTRRPFVGDRKVV